MKNTLSSGIGPQIKAARQAAGLSRKNLADRLGVTANAISNYENNVSFPKPPVLFAMFGTLGVDANTLFRDILEQ